jgi:hypothetical protein
MKSNPGVNSLKNTRLRSKTWTSSSLLKKTPMLRRAQSTRYNVLYEVRLRALIFAHLGS